MNMRIKNATKKKSPVGKYPASSPGDWRKMSFPVMLLGETVKEILQATQVTRDIVDALAPKKSRKSKRSTMTEEAEGPKTPETQRKPRKPDPETVSSNIKVRRKREKQNKRTISDSPPSIQRACSRIVFKIASPQKLGEKGHPKLRFLQLRWEIRHKSYQPLQC